jgi:hypothetical protein
MLLRVQALAKNKETEEAGLKKGLISYRTDKQEL